MPLNLDFDGWLPVCRCKLVHHYGRVALIGERPGEAAYFCRVQKAGERLLSGGVVKDVKQELIFPLTLYSSI